MMEEWIVVKKSFKIDSIVWKWYIISTTTKRKNCFKIDSIVWKCLQSPAVL